MKNWVVFFIALLIGVAIGFIGPRIINDEYSRDNFGYDDEWKANIGYLGCSNTRETVHGYHLTGGSNIWLPDMEYNSGAVKEWVDGVENGNEWWETFDKHLEENPDTKIIWWELCIPENQADVSYEDALLVINKIKEKIPGVKIYVSALPYYTKDICSITGLAGIGRSEELRDELDSMNEEVFLGPELGPMTPELTSEDGCHLSNYGVMKLGEQMREFFDEVNPGNQSLIIEESEEAGEELTGEEIAWKKVIDSAFEEINCPTSRDLSTLPNTYYKGPMIDTHIHIAPIPDSLDFEETSMPLMGYNTKITDYLCMMDSEGTDKSLGFFSVWSQPAMQPMLDFVNMTMERYPGRFIPFIMPPDRDDRPDGYPTVNSQELDTMLSVYPGLFAGYGEIGLYARGDRGGPKGSPELPPNSTRLKEIYPLIRENNLTIYFHLGEGQKESFEETLRENRDINFIFHGDQLIPYIDGKQDLVNINDILNNHPNAYYGVDELYGDVFIMNEKTTKEEFLAHFTNQEELLEKDIQNWKAFIERHPDQVLWGTDRGWNAPWSFDPEVAVTLNNYTRAFIGKLDPVVQEKYAYKNAEKLLR